MYLDKRLRPYQARVLWSLDYCIDRYPGETFTVMFPRQAGKNELSAWLVADRLIDRHRAGGSIVVVAPTLHPQAHLSYVRTLRHLRPWAELQGVKCWTEGNTIHCGAASVTFLSGSPDANVAGHTASLLLIGDEAQDIGEDWFNRQFRPMTASTGAPVVLFGTPWQGDSLLEKAVARNRQRDLETSRDEAWPRVQWHHEISWQEIINEANAYELHVRKQRELLGASNPIYLTQYELQVAADDARLLSPEHLAALAADFAALGQPAVGERYCAGLDFGGDRPGGDSTVLTVARVLPGACEVVAAWRWSGAPFREVREAVVETAAEWGFEALVCDSTGLGAPIAAALTELLGRRVHRFVFGERSKSELAFELIAAASTGGLRIAGPSTPGLAALWHELARCRAERRAGDNLAWGAPRGEHDDCVASLALCLRASRSVGAPRIARGNRAA
jgi:hypothetical protein